MKIRATIKQRTWRRVSAGRLFRMNLWKQYRVVNPWLSPYPWGGPRFIIRVRRRKYEKLLRAVERRENEQRAWAFFGFDPAVPIEPTARGELDTITAMYHGTIHMIHSTHTIREDD